VLTVSILPPLLDFLISSSPQRTCFPNKYTVRLDHRIAALKLTTFVTNGRRVVKLVGGIMLKYVTSLLIKYLCCV
jgi:hypothetical protein